MTLYETSYSTHDEASFLSYNKRQCRVVEVHSDLPQLKAFDWFPLSTNPLVYAAGLGSGKLVVTQFGDQSLPWSQNKRHEFIPKFNRACNSVAWNPSNANQIAIGLDKVRNDFCTLIWDVEYSGFSYSAPFDGGYESGMGSRRLSQKNGSVGSFSPLDNPAKTTHGTLGSNIVNLSSSHSSHATPVRNSRERILKPVHEFSNSETTAAVSWIPEHPHCLATGTGFKWLRIVDLRGATTLPTSIVAHTRAVLGVVFDPLRPNVFATYTDAAYEVAKIWDMRKLDGGPVASIQPTSKQLNDLGWCPSQPGILATSSFDEKWVSIWHVIDSSQELSGPELLKPESTITAHRKPIQKMYTKAQISSLSWKSVAKVSSNDAVSRNSIQQEFGNIFPKRLMICDVNQSTHELSFQSAMTLSLSSQGQLAFACGKDVFKGRANNDQISSFKGPTADHAAHIDIATEMQKLAKCSYSIDPKKNAFLFEKRLKSSHPFVTRVEDLPHSFLRNQQLHQIWAWICQINHLESSYKKNTAQGGLFRMTVDLDGWPISYGGLIVQGIDQLLQSYGSGDRGTSSEYTESMLRVDPNLGYSVFIGRGRRLAQIACRWDPDYNPDQRIDPTAASIGRPKPVALGLPDLVDECMSEKRFEKAAALAVFHGDLKRAATVLQRGSLVIANEEPSSDRGVAMQLVAMAIAGYSKVPSHSNTNSATTNSLWQDVCQDILKRKEIAETTVPRYLQAICLFLCAAAGSTIGEKKRHSRRSNENRSRHKIFSQILADATLPLCDRIAFATRFLPGVDLQKFVRDRALEGERRGALDGLMLTGLGDRGIKLLQCYLDTTGDIQTAALLCARVPASREGGIDDEINLINRWILNYQSLLNHWRMWEERALFDVERAELLRTYQQEPLNEKVASSKIPGQEEIPSLVYVRCNFCGVSLSLTTMLRLGASHANWLTRAKPILSCCPSCKKPLPQCSLCLLPFGALNPYFELASRRARLKTEAQMEALSSSSIIDPVRPRSNLIASSSTADLSSIPFVEWFTWCQSCRHGGHASHIAEWFMGHEECPVTDCTCHCRSLDKSIAPPRPVEFNNEVE